MSDKDAVTLADELDRAFPAGGTIGARLSDQMFRRILSALRQPAIERSDAGGLVEHLRAHGFIRDDEAEAAEQCLATLGGSDGE